MPENLPWSSDKTLQRIIQLWMFTTFKNIWFIDFVSIMFTDWSCSALLWCEFFFFSFHLVYFLHCQDWPTFLKGTIMPACPQVSLFPLSPTSIDDLEEYISRLEFRSFEENLRCLHSRTVVKPQNDATQAHMVSQIGSMERNIATHGHFYTILQKLQIPKQLEYLSNAKNEHVLNTAKWMIDDGRTSIQEFTMGYYYCWLGCLLLPCTKPHQIGLGSSKNSDTCCC